MALLLEGSKANYYKGMRIPQAHALCEEQNAPSHFLSTRTLSVTFGMEAPKRIENVLALPMSPLPYNASAKNQNPL